MPVKLSAFIGGAFGTVGLGLSVLAGVSVSNTVENVLIRGLGCAAACYVVGYGVGLIAEQISREHAARLTDRVAAQDAKDAEVAAEDQAEREAEAAMLGAASKASVTGKGGVVSAA